MYYISNPSFMVYPDNVRGNSAVNNNNFIEENWTECIMLNSQLHYIH